MGKIMKRYHKLLLIVGSVLLVVGLLVCGGAIAAEGFDLEKFDQSANAREAEHFTVSESISSVWIDSNYYDVRVEAGADIKTPELILSQDLFYYEVEDGKLSIMERDLRDEKGWKWYRLFNFNFNSDKQRLVVRLPAGYHGNLEIFNAFGMTKLEGLQDLSAFRVQNDNGALDISNVAVTEESNILSKFGNVSIHDASFADRITVSNDNGGVQLENLQFKNAMVKMQFGEFSGKALEGDELIVSVSNGGSRLENIKTEKFVRVFSNFGDIRATGLESPEIKFDSDNGGVNAEIIGRQSDYVISPDVKFGNTNLKPQFSGKKFLEVTSQFGDCNITFTEE